MKASAIEPRISTRNQPLTWRKRIKAALRERPDLAPFVSRERSVTELIRFGKYGIRLSSRDLDPAFKPAQRSDEAMQGSGNPEDYDGGNMISAVAGSPDGDDINPIVLVFDAMGEGGFAAFKVRGYDPRPSAPDWIRDSEKLIEFIKSRIAPADLEAKSVPVKAVIDYILLSAFFLDEYTDEEIFHFWIETGDNTVHQMAYLLRMDKFGSRYTNSVRALAARRERLVAAGNEYFGIKPDADSRPDTEMLVLIGCN
jgi:hypothetical protein